MCAVGVAYCPGSTAAPLLAVSSAVQYKSWTRPIIVAFSKSANTRVFLRVKWPRRCHRPTTPPWLTTPPSPPTRLWLRRCLPPLPRPQQRLLTYGQTPGIVTNSAKSSVTLSLWYSLFTRYEYDGVILPYIYARRVFRTGRVRVFNSSTPFAITNPPMFPAGYKAGLTFIRFGDFFFFLRLYR